MEGNDVEHALHDEVFLECCNKCVSHSQDAVGWAHDQDRTGQWAFLKVTVWILVVLQKRHYSVIETTLCIIVVQIVCHYRPSHLTSRTWMNASLAEGSFLGGTEEEEKMEGKAFSNSIAC